jgi:antitoxin VapB
MGLNIKNDEVERLASEIARKTGETKTEVIRKALLERRDRLGLRPAEAALNDLEQTLRGVHGGRKLPPVTKEEWDSLHD